MVMLYCNRSSSEKLVSLRNGLGILLGVALSACTWLNASKSEPSAPALVEINSGGLLRSQSGQAELGLTLTNTSNRTLWVGVHFKTPEGTTDCLLVKELEPQAKQFYSCPQKAIQADTLYPIHITIFADLRQTQMLGSLDTSFNFDQEDIKALRLKP